MLRKLFIVVSLAIVWQTTASASETLRWPASPDPARIEYVGEIRCDQLSAKTGFFGKLLRLVGGSGPQDRISLPFDLAMVGQRLFAVCQNIPALIEIFPEEGKFKLYTCKDAPLQYPVAVCASGDGRLFLSDSESRSIYIFDGEELKVFVRQGLQRPVGLAAVPSLERLFAVDTGDHMLKQFDYSGNPVTHISALPDKLMNYPTFAAATSDGIIFVNDALNYKIRRFDAGGALQASFGREGDGPGSFARPKGIALDSDGHLYVVDNLFDNIQVFDTSGQLLLVIGSQGSGSGQFWSPGGIDIVDDLIYVADTHNNRIQILRYLGERQ